MRSGDPLRGLWTRVVCMLMLAPAVGAWAGGVSYKLLPSVGVFADSSAGTYAVYGGGLGLEIDSGHIALWSCRDGHLWHCPAYDMEEGQ